MQIGSLLRLKRCLQRHIESTLHNKFKQRFSHFLATFDATIIYWVSVTTNIKNSGLLVRIQAGNKENSAA